MQYDNRPPQNRQIQRRAAPQQRSMRQESGRAAPEGRPAVAGGAPREPRPQTKVRGSRWFTAIIMVCATLFACFFLATFILQSLSDLFGLNQPDNQIEVNVPAKPTLASVSVLLHNKGVVSQPFTFRMYSELKIEDPEAEIKAGNYIFNSNFSYDQIIAALKTGNTKKEEVRITFIEGWTIYEIAKKLEENKVCDADEFLEYMDKGDIKYEFMRQVPIDALRYRRLEGYAFPDTYDFYVGMEVSKVADVFLKNFDRKITDEMREKMREMNMSIDEVIILASIIQKEAGDPVEMLMVASVFENRLKTPEAFPQLQSDVTIHYVDKFIKPFLDRQDQPLYDAYNTYKCSGLPVGAVCNPGLDAINAVLNPETSNYYFFVTDDEGTYYYAQTAQAHYNNIVKASKVGGDKVHGTATVSDVE